MLRLLVVILLLVTSIHGLKILIDQIAPSPSHLLFSGVLADSLAQRGHVVDKIIRVFHPLIPGNGTKLARRVHRIIPSPQRPIPFEKIGYMRDTFDKLKLEPWDENMLKSNLILCEDMINNEELIEQLKAEKYDVGLSPSYTACGVGLFHLLGIKSTHSYLPFSNWDGIYEVLGIPNKMVPGICLDDAKTTNPTFLQRAYSLYLRWTLRSQTEAAFKAENEIFQRKFTSFPLLIDLYHKHTYFFQNTDEVLTFQQPISSKIQNIGGITTPKPRELPEIYNRMLNSRPNGAVIVSFGSLIRTAQIPIHVQQAIVRSFARFPTLLFIWKHDDPDSAIDLVANTTNVQLVKWLPQNDLLNDRRVRVFISHVGVNSFLETSRAGVPVIAVPAIADQHYNAAAAVEREMGILVEPRDMTETTLTNALSEILENPKYSARAKEISRLLSDKPQQPAEVFVNLIEYAAKHPHLGRILDLPSRDVNTIVYYSLDVMIICLLLVILLLTAVFFLLQFTFKFLLQFSNSKEKTN
ncbi:Glucuronosyltransferase [Aphelenchoides besseyi]|nr:Glucuronosyltransferase [Aphelenchoides besseyi]